VQNNSIFLDSIVNLKRRFHGGFTNVARSASLALEESFSFSLWLATSKARLLQDSHANAHALLSELVLNYHIS
jgi:hypothetical protein